MLSNHSKQLSHAFKEWAVAIEALEAGKTIMLLRKGGIRETCDLLQTPTLAGKVLASQLTLRFFCVALA